MTQPAISSEEIELKWAELNADDGDIRVMAMLHELLELRKTTPVTVPGEQRGDTPHEDKIWSCKIGEIPKWRLPKGSDMPMRAAISAAYREITGVDPDFIFSGWGGSLDEGERACVEGRLPKCPKCDRPHYNMEDSELCRNQQPISEAQPLPARPPVYPYSQTNPHPICDASEVIIYINAVEKRLAELSRFTQKGCDDGKM